MNAGNAGPQPVDDHDAAGSVAIHPCDVCPLMTVLETGAHARPTTPPSAEPGSHTREVNRG